MTAKQAYDAWMKNHWREAVNEGWTLTRVQYVTNPEKVGFQIGFMMMVGTTIRISHGTAALFVAGRAKEGGAAATAAVELFQTYAPDSMKQFEIRVAEQVTKQLEAE